MDCRSAGKVSRAGGVRRGIGSLRAASGKDYCSVRAAGNSHGRSALCFGRESRNAAPTSSSEPACGIAVAAALRSRADPRGLHAGGRCRNTDHDADVHDARTRAARREARSRRPGVHRPSRRRLSRIMQIRSARSPPARPLRRCRSSRQVRVGLKSFLPHRSVRIRKRSPRRPAVPRRLAALPSSPADWYFSLRVRSALPSPSGTTMSMTRNVIDRRLPCRRTSTGTLDHAIQNTGAALRRLDDTRRSFVRLRRRTIHHSR